MSKLSSFLALLITVLVAASTHAQTQPSTPSEKAAAQQEISPAKKALIKELIESADARNSLEAFVNAMFDEVQKTLPGEVLDSLSNSMKDLTDAEQQKLREDVTASLLKANQRFRELFMQRIDFDKLIEDISIPLYNKYFSEAELQDLITFNRSATGQRMKEVMPKLFAESMVRSEEVLGPTMRGIIKEISSDESSRFQKEIASIVESHHRTARPRSRSRPRR